MHLLSGHLNESDEFISGLLSLSVVWVKSEEPFLGVWEVNLRLASGLH